MAGSDAAGGVRAGRVRAGRSGVRDGRRHPDTRQFGSKYGGRRYKRHNWSWGHGVKSRLKSQGERLKRQARISNYRLESYENVAVTKEKAGRVGNRRRKVRVLYIRR